MNFFNPAPWVPVFLFLLVSCSTSDNTGAGEGRALARVKEKYLYESELAGLVPDGADSATFVKEYINSWIQQQLWLQKAESNLGDEMKNFDRQLEDYRNSLITYAYERELVKQRVDTNVTEAEIEKYYLEHPDNFKLKDNIIKVVYVKVNKKVPKLEKFKQLYRSDSPRDRESLTELCHQFAENFYLNSDTWLRFDDLLKEIPIETYDKEDFLKNNRYIEFQDSLSLYFVNIKGFKIKESLSPISFEKENIRSIIINQRKLELLERLKKELYTSAQKDKDFEILHEK